MADIYKPSTNNITLLRESNRQYFDLCVSRSQYSEVEILDALQSIEDVNSALHAFKSTAWDLLEDEDGPMDTFSGFASDNHKALYEKLLSTYYVSPNFSENSHSNCFPVAKWQKEVNKLQNAIARTEKFIAKNF